MSTGNRSASGDAVDPRTFICYRGTSSGNNAGLEIARYLAETVLADAEGFSPVFFAEDNRYDFMNDLEIIFKNIERFVIVLNVNFFSGFFLEEESGEGFAPNPESSTLKEIEIALKSECEFFIVLSGEFTWEQVDPITIDRLESYYGKENVGRLRHTSNPYIWNQTDNSPAVILESFRKTSLHGVRLFLSNLQPETSRDFELDITNYAKRNNTHGSREYLREFIDANDGDIAYAAFYLLQVMLRQLKNYEQMRDIFDRYDARFSKHQSYSHIKVLFLVESGDDYDVDEVLTLAWNDCLEFSNNAGFIHLFADAYATSCELADPENRIAVIEKWGEKAEDMVNRAIELDNSYAKYYCTKARILALRNDFPAAQKNINLAIDKEDSRRNDYMIRLLNYQYYKTMIQFEKRIDSLLKGGELQC